MPDSNACQMILKYFLMNRELFIKAYHNRVYAYSSGSKFKEVCGDVAAWVEKHEVLYEKYKAQPDVRMLTYLHLSSSVHLFDTNLHALRKAQSP